MSDVQENDVIHRTDDQREADGAAAELEARRIAADRAAMGLPNIKEGEQWFVRLPGAAALCRAYISDVTPLTVELTIPRGFKNRYELTSVAFIEQVMPEPVTA